MIVRIPPIIRIGTIFSCEAPVKSPSFDASRLVTGCSISGGGGATPLLYSTIGIKCTPRPIDSIRRNSSVTMACRIMKGEKSRFESKTTREHGRIRRTRDPDVGIGRNHAPLRAGDIRTALAQGGGDAAGNLRKLDRDDLRLDRERRGATPSSAVWLGLPGRESFDSGIADTAMAPPPTAKPITRLSS